jgi:phosphoribosylaminoimidazole-succinocarboxamide synthase
MSPDNCRLWDSKTGEKMDKDRFRFDLGNLIEGYQYIARRLGLIPEGGIVQGGNIDEKLAEKLELIENELAQKRKLRGLNKPKPGKV